MHHITLLGILLKVPSLASKRKSKAGINAVIHEESLKMCQKLSTSLYFQFVQWEVLTPLCSHIFDHRVRIEWKIEFS